MKPNLLTVVAVAAIVMCFGVSVEAGGRSAKTSPIYEYPGGPRPVHCHQYRVKYRVKNPEVPLYEQRWQQQWQSTRWGLVLVCVPVNVLVGFEDGGYSYETRIETRCHPSHGHYHTQED